MKKEKLKNEWCYLLLMSFTVLTEKKKKKNKAMKSPQPPNKMLSARLTNTTGLLAIPILCVALEGAVL